MSNGPHQLHYNLYMDAAGTQVWGDGSEASGTYMVNAPKIGTDVSIPVYGRVHGRQSVPAGGYGDDIFVSLDF